MNFFDSVFVSTTPSFFLAGSNRLGLYRTGFPRGLFMPGHF
jgi:hypothetical protein